MADPHLQNYKRENVLKQHFSRLQQTAAGNQEVTVMAQSASSLLYIAMNTNLPHVDLTINNLVTIANILKEGSEYVHLGKFLLGRSIATPVKDPNNPNASWFVLDDPNGTNALPLSFIARKFGAAASFIEIGSIVALMNPLLTNVASSKMGEALICDNPAHIALLLPGHPILNGVKWRAPVGQPPPQTLASKWKEEGNQYFKQQSFQDALDCYSKAIVEDSKNAMLYSNRSATYAILGKPKEALFDAEQGLSLEKSNNKKLLYRKAKALYLLRRFADCSMFMTSDSECVRHAADREFAFLLAKSNRRCGESKTGDYDLMAMVNEAKQTGPLMDHADFVDPTLLAVRTSIPGYQYGVVALKPFTAGSLLCAVKALVYSKTQPGYNFHLQIAEHLKNDKLLARNFHQLYHSEDNENEEDRIKQILLKNCFTAGFDNRGIGFWLMPSFMNFTCVDNNCDQVTIGDFMFIRAARNIAVGEQLFLQLHPTKQTLEQREAFYREKRGCLCKCRLCQIESTETPSIRNRIRHVQAKLDGMELRFNTVSPIDAIIELDELLKEMRNLRPDHFLDPLSGQINLTMAKMKMMAGKYKEALRINKEVFKLWNGFGWLLDSIGLAMTLAVNGQMCGNNVDEINSWKVKLKNLAKLYYGDENLLNHLAPPELMASVNPPKMMPSNNLFGANRFPSFPSFRM